MWTSLSLRRGHKCWRWSTNFQPPNITLTNSRRWKHSRHRSQFNVIDHTSGWKVDFIIAEESEYGRTAMTRRMRIDIAGNAVYVASAEDVLIAKLRWAKLGGSERQLQDATGIFSTQGGSLDVAYIAHWVRELGLEEQWQAVRESSP